MHKAATEYGGNASAFTSFTVLSMAPYALPGGLVSRAASGVMAASGTTGVVGKARMASSLASPADIAVHFGQPHGGAGERVPSLLLPRKTWKRDGLGRRSILKRRARYVIAPGDDACRSSYGGVRETASPKWEDAGATPASPFSGAASRRISLPSRSPSTLSLVTAAGNASRLCTSAQSTAVASPEPSCPSPLPQPPQLPSLPPPPPLPLPPLGHPLPGPNAEAQQGETHGASTPAGRLQRLLVEHQESIGRRREARGRRTQRAVDPGSGRRISFSPSVVYATYQRDGAAGGGGGDQAGARKLQRRLTLDNIMAMHRMLLADPRKQPPGAAQPQRQLSRQQTPEASEAASNHVTEIVTRADGQLQLQRQQQEEKPPVPPVVTPRHSSEGSSASVMTPAIRLRALDSRVVHRQRWHRRKAVSFQRPPTAAGRGGGALGGGGSGGGGSGGDAAAEAPERPRTAAGVGVDGVGAAALGQIGGPSRQGNAAAEGPRGEGQPALPGVSSDCGEIPPEEALQQLRGALKHSASARLAPGDLQEDSPFYFGPYPNARLQQ
ncbi:hypothetical protein GPECTOR_256g645 [Gonium pectorale]|uniref:Uncharacterized protein n=1 Tax=Gonium pectorale TaxID=33097 RepID=A0A150FXW6_GONPE|nr:hypothetical protein GPECTOR_256g645 [Gonium pectorale]|eukprot:KXZ41870.1 hypothetical protein GPECTOR_256g645 [Gonium pectorale]